MTKVTWTDKASCGYCGHIQEGSIICQECGKFEYMFSFPRADDRAVAKIKNILRDLGIKEHIAVSLQILEALDYNVPIEEKADDRSIG